MTTVHDTGMCAITTKYLGPTNTRGGRIKACAKSGRAMSVTIPYPHEMSQPAATAAAALALCAKMNWKPDTLHTGATPDGYVFVMGAE